MKLTAQQIARELGISNATVSRVLNNRTNVSNEARQAVMDLVRQHGHMPRLLGTRARRPNPRPTPSADQMTILHAQRFPIPRIDEVVPRGTIPELTTLPTSKFFAPEARLATSHSRHIMEGIIEELGRFGIRAVVQLCEDLLDRQLIEQLNNRNNGGLFLLGIYLDSVHELLRQCRCPAISFMTWDHNGWPDYVGIDNYRGIRQAFLHLHELGHRRIAYVAGELEYSMVFRERLTAFQCMSTEAGFPHRPDWIVQGSCDIGPIQRSVEQILRSDDRPTAVMCSFDGAALAVGRAAENLNLQMPRDLSVVGFDDQDIAPLFTPPLTTVRVPTLHMGRQAVQLMMMRRQRPIQPGEGCSIRVMPSLVVRQSTAAPQTP